MRLCQDDLASYAPAAALLAVHSAISFSDALLIKLNSSRGKGEDHRMAVTAVKKACVAAKIRPAGVVHLEKLLGAKSRISYGDVQVSHEQVEALCAAADRFQAWVEGIVRVRGLAE